MKHKSKEHSMKAAKRAHHKSGGKVKKMPKGKMGPSPTTDPLEDPAAEEAKEMPMAHGGKAKKRMDKKPRAKHADGGAVGKKAPKMDAGSGGGKGRLEKSGMKTEVPIKKAMKKGGKC